MNIQIFGNKKCFETKKAERYFKERRVKYQFIDMKEKGMSRGEWDSVRKAVGGVQNMIDDKCKDKELLTLIKYLSENDCTEKVFENQQLIKTPIVRNGKLAAIGYCPEIWKEWE
ncbi:MAG: arsenate reductase family protein [Ruminococcus sp.]